MNIFFPSRESARVFARKRTANGYTTSVKDDKEAQPGKRYSCNVKRK